MPEERPTQRCLRLTEEATHLEGSLIRHTLQQQDHTIHSKYYFKLYVMQILSNFADRIGNQKVQTVHTCRIISRHDVRS
jgi:hypothetical protein